MTCLRAWRVRKQGGRNDSKTDKQQLHRRQDFVCVHMHVPYVHKAGDGLYMLHVYIYIILIYTCLFCFRFMDGMHTCYASLEAEVKRTAEMRLALAVWLDLRHILWCQYFDCGILEVKYCSDLFCHQFATATCASYFASSSKSAPTT